VSATYTIGLFAFVIILMVVMISKWHIHAAFGILFAALILAIGLGTPWAKIEGTINTGFANTIKSVGIVIMLGCTMGTVMEKTGAAVRITKSAIQLFGKKNIVWAIAASSFILGIPIWADTCVILLIPIVSMIAVETKKSMMCLGTVLYMGALVTASLVPPTPGPIAAAALLKVPIGETIIWGLIVAVPSVIAATLYCLTLKDPVLPKEEYVEAGRKAESDPNYHLPSLFTSLLPIVFPLILIVINTFASGIAPKSQFAQVMKFVGSPMVALLAGCILSLILTGDKWHTKLVTNDWVDLGIKAAAMPIIVTGMGGALAVFIKNSGVAKQIAEIVVSYNIPGILIPFIIACLIHVITGSNALGVMTAAALVEPLLNSIGVTPLAAFLACGTGALVFKHANSSGFWVTVTMSNMDVSQGIKAVGGGATVAGITGGIVTCILFYLHLI
jgi:gluconate:H+ symporter, GntP family